MLLPSLEASPRRLLTKKSLKKSLKRSLMRVPWTSLVYRLRDLATLPLDSVSLIGDDLINTTDLLLSIESLFQSLENESV